MKKQYQMLEMLVEVFENEDVVTMSASDYDGTGEIPENW